MQVGALLLCPFLRERCGMWLASFDGEAKEPHAIRQLSGRAGGDAGSLGSIRGLRDRIPGTLVLVSRGCRDVLGWAGLRSH